jgi:hypothetical protein
MGFVHSGKVVKHALAELVGRGCRIDTVAFDPPTLTFRTPEGARCALVVEGDTVRVEPDVIEPLEGVVDYLRPNFVGIRTADALYRFFGRNAFGMPVGMAIHAFADGVDKDATQAAWQEWLNRLYA